MFSYTILSSKTIINYILDHSFTLLWLYILFWQSQHQYSSVLTHLEEFGCISICVAFTVRHNNHRLFATTFQYKDIKCFRLLFFQPTCVGFDFQDSYPMRIRFSRNFIYSAFNASIFFFHRAMSTHD